MHIYLLRKSGYAPDVHTPTILKPRSVQCARAPPHHPTLARYDITSHVNYISYLAISPWKYKLMLYQFPQLSNSSVSSTDSTGHSPDSRRPATSCIIEQCARPTGTSTLSPRPSRHERRKYDSTRRRQIRNKALQEDWLWIHACIGLCVGLCVGLTCVEG